MFWNFTLPGVVLSFAMLFVVISIAKDSKLPVIQFFALIAVWQLASAGYTHWDTKVSEYESVPASMNAADFFGFESGEVYPVELGNRSDQLSATAYADAGFFVSSSSISIESSSILSIGFTSAAGESFILELPLDIVTFIKDDELDPTVVVYLSDTSGGYGNMALVEQAPCQWGFDTILLACQRPGEPAREFQIDDTTRQTLTLSQVVASGAVGAEITLPSAEWERILG